MSISGSLSNALSGLTAASRAAEVVSSNVANALTPGYGRRQIELASRALGGVGAGVVVVGVTRAVDQRIISERRLADATLGNYSTQADFLMRLEMAVGLPDDPSSLTGRIAQFEAALIEATSRPDSGPRLSAVFDAAQGLATHLNSVSDQIQNLRMESDQDIARQVALLNDRLAKISTLNHDIQSQLGAGYDVNALIDHRQQLIDSISAIVPLREIARDNGQIALFTPGGVILVDSKAAVFTFSPVGVIVPEMTIDTGALSGLSINGQPVSTTAGGPISGGSLASLFAVRDELAVSAQERLDAVARDLVERFADPAVDPTLSPTDPGLFTDDGLTFSPVNEIGLSSRVAVNALVNPKMGGALWRLRDGLGAAAPGNVGNAVQLLALVDALSVARVPASGGFMGAARSAVGLAGELVSLMNADQRSNDADQSFASAKVYTLTAIELRSGVDTDYELEQLLLIEQAFAANARIIATVDEMIQLLLGL